MFDYVARSPAELSFKVGELVILHSKASCDWWRGEVGGVKGLIPHKYISMLEGWVTFVLLKHSGNYYHRIQNYCRDDLPRWRQWISITVWGSKFLALGSLGSLNLLQLPPNWVKCCFLSGFLSGFFLNTGQLKLNPFFPTWAPWHPEVLEGLERFVCKNQRLHALLISIF